MSDEIDEVVENIKQGSVWLRILFILGFFVALYVVGVILGFLIIAQALFTLLTGSPNENLQELAASLTAYVSQILRYQTYNSDRRPFPFSPFPGTDGSESDEDESEPEVPKKGRPAAKKKAPAKKAAAKKQTNSAEKKSAEKPDADVTE